MIQGLDTSCRAVGIVPAHGAAIQQVADRTHTIVLFRDPGPLCAGLAEEHYAMKSFRVHAKSCDWGPMSGLVCMDPRLNKEPGNLEKANFNRNQNIKALRGELDAGMVIRQNFTAGVVPLVISRTRLEELRSVYGLQFRQEPGGCLAGMEVRNGIVLPWIAIPVSMQELNRLSLIGPNPRYSGGQYYGLFVDDRGGLLFRQEYLAGVRAALYQYDKNWFEWLFGMSNTGWPVGFKDCVTGDLDLFAVWPSNALFGFARLYPGAPRDSAHREVGYLDQRPLQYAKSEYSQMGNISERVQYIAFQVNDAVRAAGYLGGDACSHSDEAQNPFARNLENCFPPKSAGVIAFVPRGLANILHKEPVLVLESVLELQQFGHQVSVNGYHIDMKDDWSAKM